MSVIHNAACCAQKIYLLRMSRYFKNIPCSPFESEEAFEGGSELSALAVGWHNMGCAPVALAQLSIRSFSLTGQQGVKCAGL